MMTEAPSAVSSQRVEAVERALSLLDAFRAGAETLSLSELAARTGFYKSTILRLSASLIRFGYLRRGSDGRFRLGPTLWRLGTLYRRGFRLGEQIRPILLRLVTQTQESASFYIREGDVRICLFRENSARAMRHHIEEGDEVPLDRGAAGRVLLAFGGATEPLYDAIRAEGAYVSLGERDQDVAAIAAPVFGADDELAGALAVSGPRSRFSPEWVAEARRALLAMAAELSRALGAPTHALPASA